MVLTLPKEIAGIACQNKARVYGILFRAAADTLSTIAADPKHLGAEIGFFAVLHTWVRICCIIPTCIASSPAGALSGRHAMDFLPASVLLAGSGSRRPRFFLPVPILSCLFRRLFLGYLQERLQRRGAAVLFVLGASPGASSILALPGTATAGQMGSLRQAALRRTGAGPGLRRTLYASLPSPTNRLLDIEDGTVRFRWKDYRNGKRQKVMTVSADEFIGRFLLHTLPDGFHRIRYCGFLANRHRAQKLARCRELLAMPVLEPLLDQSEQDYRDSYEELTGVSLKECPANGADRGGAPSAASE